MLTSTRLLRFSNCLSSYGRQNFSTVVCGSSFNPLILKVDQFATTSYNGQEKSTTTAFPKRPLNPFFKLLGELRVKNENISAKELARMAARQWKEMPDEKKEAYKSSYHLEITNWKNKIEDMKTDMAMRNELEDFLKNEEKKKIERALKKTNQKKQTLLDEIKKPKSFPRPFSLFIKEKLPAMKTEHKGKLSSELMSDLGKKWNEMTSDQKMSYINKSEKLKVEYEEAMARWKSEFKASEKLQDLEKINNKLKRMRVKKKDFESPQPDDVKSNEHDNRGGLPRTK